MEESFCALAHWHQVTVDYKGGLVHAVSTDSPHLKCNTNHVCFKSDLFISGSTKAHDSLTRRFKFEQCGSIEPASWYVLTLFLFYKTYNLLVVGSTHLITLGYWEETQMQNILRLPSIRHTSNPAQQALPNLDMISLDLLWYAWGTQMLLTFRSNRKIY